MANEAARTRCHWAEGHPLLAAYHDEEWGVPVHDDRHWYEKLTLDGAQAGLSWLTILKRREGYRAAFCDFDVERVAKLGERDVDRLMEDTGIIRNRLKILSAIQNARAFMRVQEEFGSFDAFIWAEVGGRPLRGSMRLGAPPDARTELSDALSKKLKKRGFSFVGSTIVYAFMQAAGLVNDHRPECWRTPAIDRMAKAYSASTPATGTPAKKAPAKKAPAKKAPAKKAPAKKAPAKKAARPASGARR